MAAPQVPPSIANTTFSCPHCGAYAPQTWFSAWARKLEGAPDLVTQDLIDRVKTDKNLNQEQRSHFLGYLEKALNGTVFIDDNSNSQYVYSIVNVHFSTCFACKKAAVWAHDRVILPLQKSGPEANPDLPLDVLRDYEEAQSVVSISPRGAAALLRLAIQKLCKVLGGSGDKLDADIAALVKNGLSPLVQKALDIVRVIGNESVHPGKIDIRDDMATALKLFGLVNLIAEQMISTPKHVESLYGSLPEGKRKAIEQRDKAK